MCSCSAKFRPSKSLDRVFNFHKGFCWTSRSSSNHSLTSDGGLNNNIGGSGGGGGGGGGGLHNRGAVLAEGDGESSVDSGHGGTGKSRSRGGVGVGAVDGATGASPLVFDQHHFSRASPVTASASASKVIVDVSPGMDELRSISTVERLVKTNSIWLLASMSRAGAVHILKDRDTGNFIVRKSSQPQSLALSVQSRLCGHSAVDHYLIQSTTTGFRLEGSAHLFHSIPALIAYYIENIDEIPYHLRLPVAIQQARSTRELASLDLLGQDFWSSPLSRRSPLPHQVFGGQLHKSHSEPINIQKQTPGGHTPFHCHQGHDINARRQLVNNTPPSRSTESFAHFMHTQAEMERYFARRIQEGNSSFSDGPHSPALRSGNISSFNNDNSFNTPSPGFVAGAVMAASVVTLPRNVDSSAANSPAATPRTGTLPAPCSDVDKASHLSRSSPQPNRAQLGANSSPSLLQNECTDPEPIYSVSKKQKKKKVFITSTVVDTGQASQAAEGGTDLTSSLSGAASPLTSSISATQGTPLLKVCMSSEEVSSLQPGVQRLSLQDEDGYRRSTSNMAAGITSSASWDQGLAQSHKPEGVKDRAWTHPRSGVDPSRPKANLYFTTNLGLLEIPESTYFTSNLSDKLSDYEDIWRTSCAESDQDAYRRSSNGQHGSCTTAKMIADPRAMLDARIGQYQYQQQQQPSILSPGRSKELDKCSGGAQSPAGASVKEGKRKVLRKTSRDGPASRRVPVERDAVTGGTTGLTALEEARKIAGSTSDEDNAVSPTSPFHPHHPPPIAHVKGIRRLTDIFDYEDEDGDAVVDETSRLRTPHDIIPSKTGAVTTKANRTVAISKTAMVTNTNSIHILPSRPNQIKFVTSHSLDFSPRDSNTPVSSKQTMHAITAASSAQTPTPTSIKSLPAQMFRDVTPTCVLTTTMAVIVSEPSEPHTPPPPATSSSAINATKPTPKPRTKSPAKTTSPAKTKEKSLMSPLSRLSRLKSSSESSLATVSSPLYAEPADAVKLRDKHGRAINIHVRRQSAPTGPQHVIHHNKQEQHQPQASSKVSQNPNLETIFSPGVEGSDRKVAASGASKFTFEGFTEHGGKPETPIGATSPHIISRSVSMRTAHEQSQLERKQSWKDRLHRLKLGTRVLTRNLTPPSAPSARKHLTQTALTSSATAQTLDSSDLLAAMEVSTCSLPTVQLSPAPSTPTLGKFPVVEGHLFHPRDSCFSESSTVQDLISCAHPELSVRPILTGPKVGQSAGESQVVPVARDVPAVPSEYDNLGTYRASTHSNDSTVYSPPWDTSAASRLMRESPLPPHHAPRDASSPRQQKPHPYPRGHRPLHHHPYHRPGLSTSPPPLPLNPPPPVSLSLSNVEKRLPPAMDFQERIARWQESNTNYMSQREIKSTAAAGADAANIVGAVGDNGAGDLCSWVLASGNASVGVDKQQLQPASMHERHLQMQQQQLLHHQQQLKNNDKVSSNNTGNTLCAQRQLSDGAGKHQQQRQPQNPSDPSSTNRSQDIRMADPIHPLPPLNPNSPTTPNMANSIALATAKSISSPTPFASSPALLVSSPTPFATSTGHFVSSPTPFVSSPGHFAPSSSPFASSPTPFPVASSPHRLSSHCPDVVHCHSTPGLPTSSSPSFLSHSLQGYGATDAELTASQMVGEDDVLFGGSMTMASPELQRQISPVLSEGCSVGQTDKAPGTKIREYIFKLSNNRTTTFGSTIENFIQCTLDSQETNPQHVLRNVRQFMTGIKNYLVKHGEGMLEDLIERERNKLEANEILNIDAIIEQALHVCVLKPLKYHIYRLFVEEYSATRALEQLSRNIKYARTKTAEDLGVKPSLNVPGRKDMEVIKYYLDLMQRSYSPLQKLQNLLKATSTIYHCVQGKQHQFPSRGPSSLGADDFLPMLIYVLVHCGLVSAEIEADFMWGLLQPSLLTGEGGYYLTTLSSAVLVLKNFQETHDLAPVQHEGQLPTLSDMQGFLKIAIPDELHDSINWKTLPVRPNMNTRDVCALVAHKFKVTNPQDYGLFLLCDGQESQMTDGDCPQIIKGDYVAAKKNCFFAFKRIDANIAWPRQMKESTLTVSDSV